MTLQAPLIKGEKKSETCEEQLRRNCKNIADGITNPNQEFITHSVSGPEYEEPRQETASDWMEDVYDIEWITHQDHSYKAARLLVAGGGPNIWVNLLSNTVDGYWGCDKYSHGFIDNIGLDNYCEEMHGCK